MKIFKMPFRTRHFNQNQKVIVIELSGNEAALVRGRFRGKGRYINAWVKWHGKERPKIIEIG